ncbi:HupE/UreJ family protein [Henriciella litoralis]|uniref:HupE/UreJ family protein n=1 Tax=Henriciella litoralis TaxID=568102 RepID=UPI000A00BAED|nr:HupE/UreJ family protein [Henriciella litoralis]
MTSVRLLLVFLVVGLVSWCGTLPAAAHESRPLYLELTQTSPNVWRLFWKVPPSVPEGNLPSLELPPGCSAAGGSASRLDLVPNDGSILVSCEGPLQGGEITIQYGAFNPSISTMTRLSAIDGTELVGILAPQDSVWTIPQDITASSVARDYTLLGIDHIWKGWDHLLFLVCLLWIAGSFRRVLITITGFTVAHSLTLALSTLGLVNIPIPPVEAAIALSIVFLAREIAVGRRNSLTWNRPVLVSASFGLLHGLGFAAVLAEIGLPQTQLVTSLLFFNVGVEIGQVLFVAAVAGIFWAVRFLLRGRAGQAIRVPASGVQGRLLASYAVGVLASYWLVERVAGFWI